MPWGLVGALAAALAYGTATVLQAVGVRRVAGRPPGSSFRTRVRLGYPFVLGLALDGVGFLSSIAALRSLPLFLVESAVASSVAVTAVLVVVVLHVRLLAREVVALAAVALGLVLLALTAVDGPARPGSDRLGWWILATVVPLAVALLVGIRWRSPAGSVVLLAATSGLGYGVVGVASRVLDVGHPWWHTLAQPALWAILGSAVIGVVGYAQALGRGRTTSVAAITVTVETLVPAAVGLGLLGDAVRPHLGLVAGTGFVVTLAGCLVLSLRPELSPETA
ncbi:MAG TPA: hypothetical protein VHO26_04770 [Propionibacteriaceae bacterium]|nr:hypothetical protein [Propionibacteriaceae bacterium]